MNIRSITAGLPSKSASPGPGPIWKATFPAFSGRSPELSTLLTSSQLARVRDCADATCGWVFIDQSKNASRRWCDMGDCGNRAKARRYRARQKADAAE